MESQTDHLFLEDCLKEAPGPPPKSQICFDTVTLLYNFESLNYKWPHHLAYYWYKVGLLPSTSVLLLWMLLKWISGRIHKE